MEVLQIQFVNCALHIIKQLYICWYSVSFPNMSSHLSLPDWHHHSATPSKRIPPSPILVAANVSSRAQEQRESKEGAQKWFIQPGTWRDVTIKLDVSSWWAAWGGIEEGSNKSFFVV
jgi:hypothetical protein